MATIYPQLLPEDSENDLLLAGGQGLDLGGSSGVLRREVIGYLGSIVVGGHELRVWWRVRRR